MDYLVTLKNEIDALLDIARDKGQAVIDIDTDTIFLPDNHQFASQLAEDIATRLQFCLHPPKLNHENKQYA